MTQPIFYEILDDQIIVVSKYDGQQDIAVTLKKTGPNHLFEFFNIAFIPNTRKEVSRDTGSRISRYYPGTDWHMPYIMRAVENGDGDKPEKRFYTGGNHGYDNTSSPETSATGKTAKLCFLVDGFPVFQGSGYCGRLEFRWTNLIQGYNTTKEDGSGRAILRENHKMTFDGKEWNSYVELIPLETVCIESWYGFGCNFVEPYYTHIRYPGGNNREELGIVSSSGNKDCYRIEIYGDHDKIILELDPLLDLGKRELYEGDSGAFSMPYHKVYFHIIHSSADETLRTWQAGQMHVIRCKYIFEAMI